MSEARIGRTGPPQAIQRVRENTFLVQVPLSATPTGDWRRLFYEAQQEVPPDFPPRSIEISGTLLRFRSEPAAVAGKIGVIDRWIDRANQKEAAMAGRSEEQRRKHEEQAREQKQLAEWNASWAKL